LGVINHAKSTPLKQVTRRNIDPGSYFGPDLVSGGIQDSLDAGERRVAQKRVIFSPISVQRKPLKNLAQPSQQEEGYPPFAGGLILSQQERDMANIGIFLAAIREKPAKSPN
jgi:hypothetical protein